MKPTSRSFSFPRKQWLYTLGVTVLALGLTVTASSSAMGTGSALSTSG